MRRFVVPGVVVATVLLGSLFSAGPVFAAPRDSSPVGGASSPIDSRMVDRGTGVPSAVNGINLSFTRLDKC